MISNKLIELSFWFATFLLIADHSIRKKKIRLEMKKIDNERLNDRIKQLEDKG